MFCLEVLQVMETMGMADKVVKKEEVIDILMLVTKHGSKSN